MTLVEVTIAMAVGLVAVLGLTQALNTAFRSTADVKLTGELETTMNNVKLVLSHEDFCKLSLQGQVFNNNQKKIPDDADSNDVLATIPQIKMKTQDGKLVTFLEKSDPNQAGLRITKIELRAANREGVKAALLDCKPPGQPDQQCTYTAWLRVEAEKAIGTPVESVIGGRTISREMLLSVVTELSAGRNVIQDCHTQESQESPAKLCADIGGTYDENAPQPCQLPGTPASTCAELGGTYDPSATPPCKLPAPASPTIEQTCRDLGGTYTASATPPCRLPSAYCPWGEGTFGFIFKGGGRDMAITCHNSQVLGICEANSPNDRCQGIAAELGPGQNQRSNYCCRAPVSGGGFGSGGGGGGGAGGGGPRAF